MRVTEITQPAEELLDSFRNAMRHVAATVYAVTTGSVVGAKGGSASAAGRDGQDGRFGILATAVSSLSFAPPSLLVCVNRTASLHDPLAEADIFAVNVLGLGNRDVADHFMVGPADKRFAVGDWEDRHGAPVLTSAQSSLVCKRVHAHEFGTHTIFIGELIAAYHRQDATPLTYYDRRYIDISEAPLRNDGA